MVVACTAEPEPAQTGDTGDTGSESTTETTSSGDGDGDGDPNPGDGDGEPATGDGDGDPAPLACAGHVELCERPFDEVVFAGTHNSHAALEDGYTPFNANHNTGVGPQLEAGVRALLLDTYYEGDSIVLCHGPCNLGSTPHLEVLQQLVDFLVANPGEFITIIYQDAVSAEDLALDYEATGAIDLVYAHPEGQPWPTLGEMVEADTRLIVTAEQGGPPPAWHHNIWQIGWDTPYGPMDPADLSCELNRGSADNDLFLVNHWVNNDIGLPSAEDADVVNAYDFLIGRAQDCWAMWDHPPNILAIDFWERGDLFEVVETLNGF